MMRPYRFDPASADQPEPSVAPSQPAPAPVPGPERLRRRRSYRGALILLALIGGIAIGAAGMFEFARRSYAQQPATIGAAQPNEQHGAPAPSAPQQAPSAPQQAPATASGATAPTVASAVYAMVNQSVVQIATDQGSGSGVVVDASGLVLTNNHVVEGSERVTVLFSDGQRREGQVLGTDRGNDLAVVKVDLPENVTPATLADSDQVQVGEVAIAIGSPFGLDQTVTQGIVSAVHRDWEPGDGSVQRDLIQTDAPINPGNSGGPLLNARGEVIGINTMIESPVRGSVGVGFAIPINTAKARLSQLASGTDLEPVWLGIGGQDTSSGVEVSGVAPGSPAEQAGLREGDVITAIDGNAVGSIDELAADVSNHQPGDDVSLTVTRAGDTIELTATLQARPEQNP
jgi:putative serine protease PepD